MSSFYPGVRPSDLVPGDTAVLETIVQRLGAHRNVLGETDTALQHLDTSGWTGTAADSFRQVFEAQPGRYLHASDQLATGAGAIANYNGALAEAQSLAGQAIAVAEGRPPSSLLQTIEHVVEDGLGIHHQAALLAEAERMLDQARSGLDAAASDLSRALRTAGETAFRPIIPNRVAHGNTNVTPPKRTGGPVTVGTKSNGGSSEPHTPGQTSEPKPQTAPWPVTPYSQKHSGLRFPSEGCAITATASVLTFLAQKADPGAEPITPVDVQNTSALVDDSDYDMRWSDKPLTFSPSGGPRGMTFTITQLSRNDGGGDGSTYDANIAYQIDTALESGPVIIGIGNVSGEYPYGPGQGGSGHYIVITGKGPNSGEYTIMDPATGTIVANGFPSSATTDGYSWTLDNVTQVLTASCD